MTDQFITLFDHGFAHHGLVLYRSLRRWHPQARLAVIAMDARCETLLRGLACPDLSIIPVEEVLDDGLRAVRADRSRSEFCWTLSPVAVQTALALAGPGGRGIYVDADLWFRGRVDALLAGMDGCDAGLQVTEHGFPTARAKRWERKAGRFCVQWVAARDGTVAHRLLQWWRERCTEWCFHRFEPGRFGDQKYLDAWPGMAEGRLHVLPAESIAAPWNMGWLMRERQASWDPPCVHFHAFRAISRGWRQVKGYRLPASVHDWYAAYQGGLETAMTDLRAVDGTWTPTLMDPQGPWQHLKAMVGLLSGHEMRTMSRVAMRGR